LRTNKTAYKIPTQEEDPVHHSLCHIVFQKLLQNSKITNYEIRM